jgi:ATP-dependent helicase Lhr and Lhr-like helicase
VTTNSPNSGSEQNSASFDLLSEPVRRWIWQNGWDELRDIQERAIPVLLEGTADVIIAAATAGGKTEAAFLPLISRIAGKAGRGFKLLYISPLKALINDQFRRLEELCEAVDLPVHKWHGDVSATTKTKARRDPDGIVLITPESIEALFVRRGIEIAGLFAPLEAVVIDELHAFIGNERGTQLQSLLRRLEVVLGRPVRRIGLSATLGDMAIAAEFLRPGHGKDCVVLESRADGQTLMLQLRGYLKEEKAAKKKSAGEANPVQASGAQDDDSREVHDIAQHLFDTLRGSHGLIFAGSRRNVEVYADLLRRQSETLGVPDEFHPHHANLSRAHREFVESRLRDSALPASAVCTSTLELGIDIGMVESVAQIGAPWSVAGLRQRLGRSGRRADKPAVIRLYIAERELQPDLHPADALRCELVQAIAMVQLLVKGWCEPPRTGTLHLSTLLHQVLALISQYGGVTATRIYDILSRGGPFYAVSPSLFSDVLRSMGGEETKLIEQAPDGTLLLGALGERIVDGRDFYAVFQTPEEYRVVCDGKPLGTIPILTAIVPEMTIIFSGRRWQVVEVDDSSKTITVIPAGAGVPPLFGGEGGNLHDTVVAEMRRIYESEDVPPFLDAKARDLVAEARRSFNDFGLRRVSMLERNGDTFLFPWSGTIACSTLILALKDIGVPASTRGIVIEIERTQLESVTAVLDRLAANPPPNPVHLASKVSNLEREKYDRFLPRSVLAIGFAADRLTPEVVPALARQLIAD